MCEAVQLVWAELAVKAEEAQIGGLGVRACGGSAPASRRRPAASSARPPRPRPANAPARRHRDTDRHGRSETLLGSPSPGHVRSSLVLRHARRNDCPTVGRQTRGRPRPHRGRCGPHRAARQRRAGVASSTPSRRTPSRWHGVRVHQMHALHDRPYLHGAMREHLLHVSYFLSPVTRPAFHERGCELVPEPLQRGAAPPAGDDEVLDGARRGRADGPARLLLAGHQLRLRRARSSGARPSSSRSTPACPARSGGTRSTSARSPGWTEVDRPLVRDPAARPIRCRRADRRAGGRAHPGRRHDPGRHRIDSQRAARRLDDHRDLGVHTELLSDAMHRPHRAGCGHRHPQALGAGQGRDDVRARHATPLRLPRTRTPRSSSCRSTTSTTHA